MERLINESIRSIEIQHKIRINYQFKHTEHFRDVSRYSVNASQAPILVVNGHVECAGPVSHDMLRTKLTALNRE
jgi:hypothetical protein